MTWVSHKTISFFSACLLGFDIISSFAIALSSILPDAIENNNLKKHRKNSHFWGIWISLIVVGYYFYSQNISALTYNISFFLIYIGLGGFFHVAQDMLTISGVPLFWGSKRKIAIPIIKTKSISEYVFLLFFLTFSFLYLTNSLALNQIYLPHISNVYLTEIILKLKLVSA